MAKRFTLRSVLVLVVWLAQMVNPLAPIHRRSADSRIEDSYIVVLQVRRTAK